MTGKKLVLAYVDSLRTDMLELAVKSGKAPTFGRLIDRGVLIRDCVSSFPSVTPVACAEMVTGLAGESHWISGMNWYHRLEKRYVEYGSSLEASRAFGIFRSLYDLVYNMNLAHLNPSAETVFESLDDAGVRTACTPFLIYRGRHRHQVSLEGLMKRAIDVSGLKLNHHTWGPKELFYGDLYASRPFPCRSSSIPGSRDGYSACCAAELAAAGLYDFLLLSLPDNDNYSHRHGPEASVESIAKADHCFTKLTTAAGGLDGFLASHSLILLADHAHTAVQAELPLAEILGERWRVLRPSDDSPELAQLAVSPTGRAAHLYRIGEAQPSQPQLLAALGAVESVDICCWLSNGPEGPAINRDQPGLDLADPDLWARIDSEAGQIAFRPGATTEGGVVADRRSRAWKVIGDDAAIGASRSGQMIDSHDYPDALGRVWAALASPHAGDVVISLKPGTECVDWGGASHVGGGSHGSLHRGDSLGPLLFAGCGPADPSERDQWSLLDVAPVIREHFGLAG